MLGRISLREVSVPIPLSYSIPHRMKSTLHIILQILKQNPTPEHSNHHHQPLAECSKDTDISVPFVNINVSSFHFSDRSLGQASACSCGSVWKPIKNYSYSSEQQYFSTPVKQVPKEAQKWSQQKERFLLSVSVFNSKVTVLQSRFNKMVELFPAVHRWLFTCTITDPCLAPCWTVSADQSCSKDSAP